MGQKQFHRQGGIIRGIILMTFLVVTILTGNTCFGERWVFPVTFEDYNISVTLQPYLLTEEEWPPVS